MTDFEDRARSAGDALRTWTPGDDTPSPDTAVRRAVRRTRVHRATAGGLLVAALGGVGLLWGPNDGGNDVHTGPAGTSDAPTTTEEPANTGPFATTPTEPDDDESAGGAEPAVTSVPSTTATTTTPTTTEAPPAPTTCTGQIGETSITFVATLPAGWHHNEVAMGEPGCHHFAPVPVDLRPTETEAGVGVASNAVVKLYLPHRPGQLPTSFEQSVDDRAAGSDVTDIRRTTVDGHAAARFEQLTGPGDDVPVGGERFVRWTIDLGDVWLDAVTLLEPGVSYEESVAAIDQIVGSLDFSA
jgi:hypothetical protein